MKVITLKRKEGFWYLPDLRKEISKGNSLEVGNQSPRIMADGRVLHGFVSFLIRFWAPWCWDCFSELRHSSCVGCKGHEKWQSLCVAAVLSRLPGCPVLLMFSKTGHCFLNMLPLPLSSLWLSSLLLFSASSSRANLHISTVAECKHFSYFVKTRVCRVTQSLWLHRQGPSNYRQMHPNYLCAPFTNHTDAFFSLYAIPWWGQGKVAHIHYPIEGKNHIQNILIH